MSEITQYNQNDLLQMLITANIIPNNCPKSMVDMFFERCHSTGLKPLDKHLYIIPRKDNRTNEIKYSFQTSIDGFRSIAENTGQYFGSSEPLFDGGLTEYELRAKNVTIPTTATITIEKIIDGKIGKFTATASWESYAVVYNGKPSGMWQKFPFLMLAKCAEALALRKAFPMKLSGLYTTDEMQQAGGEIKVETPSVQLMKWSLAKGLTKEQVIKAKETFFPEVEKLDFEQCQELKKQLEFILQPKTELFATKDVEGVYGTD